MVEYNLDEMVHQIVPPVKEGGASEASDGRFTASNNFNYHFLTTSRVYEQKIRNPLTITLVQEHL
jgi:hypothetical protein